MPNHSARSRICLSLMLLLGGSATVAGRDTGVNGAELAFTKGRVRAVLSTEEGLERKIQLDNLGDEQTVIQQLTIDSRVSLSYRRGARQDPVEVDENGVVELPLDAGESVRILLWFDGAAFEFGEHQFELAVHADGLAEPLRLPVMVEVVDPEEEDFDPTKERARVPEKLVTDGPQPKLEVDRHVHDFGRRLAGEDLQTTFTIRNRGEGALVLQALRKQCSCSFANLTIAGEEVPKERFREETVGTIEPGEEAVLTVDVDTTGMTGALEKSFWIYSNDKAQGHQTPLKIAADLENPFRVRPPSAYFGAVRIHDAPTQRIVVDAPKLEQFTITGHSMRGRPLFEVETRELERAAKRGPATEIVLRLRPDALLGRHKGNIEFQVEDAPVSRMRLSYNVEVLGDVDFLVGNKIRGDVSFDLVKPPANLERSFEVVNHRAEVPYQPTRVEVEALQGAQNSVIAELVELEPGVRYQIIVRVVADPRSTLFQGFVHVYSDHPQLPAHKLRYHGRYLGPRDWKAEGVGGDGASDPERGTGGSTAIENGGRE